MPTPTYDLIASNVLSSSASSVTFSSIPATYRDLVVVAQPINTVGDTQLAMRLNSDTGTNYSRVVMGGNGSTAQSASNTLDRILTGYDSSMTNSQDSLFIVQLMDYSVTDKHKTLLIRGNRAAGGTDAHAVRWANTAAVNTILLYPFADSFASGSSFYLYGISA